MLYQKLYSRLAFLTLLLLFASVQTSDARQVENEIRSMLEQRETEIKNNLGSEEEISSEQKEELRSAVNDMFDFGAMGRAALGRHWNDLTAAQRTNFVDVFAEIVRHQSLADVDVYRAEVTYDQVVVTGNEAKVMTTTTYKDVPTEVVYVLALTGETWLATDVILDEVSTVDGYSRSFQSVIRKRGFDALMTSLNKRLDRARNES